ncbi:ABC transporter B family member 13 [Bienertia sinuspersici]
MVLIATAFSVAEALSLTPEIVKGSDALGSVFSIIKRKTAIDSNDPKVTEVTDIKGYIEFKDDELNDHERAHRIDIRSLNLKSLRRSIGLNIRYGNEGATEIEIMKAAKAANAHGLGL